MEISFKIKEILRLLKTKKYYISKVFTSGQKKKMEVKNGN